MGTWGKDDVATLLASNYYHELLTIRTIIELVNIVLQSEDKITINFFKKK